LEKLITGVIVRQTNRPVGDPRDRWIPAKIKASSTNSRGLIGRIHEARGTFFDEASDSRLLVNPLRWSSVL